MKNIIFDVDDTLYNLMEPFEKAHKELMAARTDADCENICRCWSRSQQRRGKTIRRTIPLLPKAYSGTRNYKTDP